MTKYERIQNQHHRILMSTIDGHNEESTGDSKKIPSANLRRQPAGRSTLKVSAPTSQPTSQPTMRQSKHISICSGLAAYCECSKGYVKFTYQFGPVTTFSCFSCNPGTSPYILSGLKASCSPCLTGTFSAGGDKKCESCPLNTVTSSAGATSISDCVSPAASFSEAIILLIVIIPICFVYMCAGRIHLLSFVRNTRLIGNAVPMWMDVYSRIQSKIESHCLQKESLGRLWH
jgi:Tyrosine-protein kinase ephrin type A/B receptor-like